MRTTLNLDEDVLIAAKEIADSQNISLGKAVSMLLRKALISPTEVTTRNGISLFPRQPGGQLVTLDVVNQLRDQEPA